MEELQMCPPPAWTQFTVHCNCKHLLAFGVWAWIIERSLLCCEKMLSCKLHFSFKINWISTLHSTCDVYMSHHSCSRIFLLHKPQFNFPSSSLNESNLIHKASKYVNCSGNLCANIPFLFTCFWTPLSPNLCLYLCPCVLHLGIRRNTVWTPLMPSKSLVASCLHGMDCVPCG